jgi:hypothetical protein
VPPAAPAAPATAEATPSPVPGGSLGIGSLKGENRHE